MAGFVRRRDAESQCTQNCREFPQASIKGAAESGMLRIYGSFLLFPSVSTPKPGSNQCSNSNPQPEHSLCESILTPETVQVPLPRDAAGCYQTDRCETLGPGISLWFMIIGTFFEVRNFQHRAVCYSTHVESSATTINPRELTWDSDLANDDEVGIILDTNHDRGNAFLFVVNPLGTQRDAPVEHRSARPLHLSTQQRPVRYLQSDNQPALERPSYQLQVKLTYHQMWTL